MEAIRDCNQQNNIVYDISINCRYDLENDAQINELNESVKDRDFAREILDKAIADRRIHFIEIDIDQYIDVYRIRFRILPGIEYFIQDFQQIYLEWSKIISLKIAKKVFQSIRELIPVSEPIKFEDNFFFIGGNSLLLLKLQRKLNAQFSINLDLLDLINRPIISAFIAIIESLIFNTSKKEIIKIKDSPQIIEVIYTSHSTPNLVMVLFHSLIGGNLCYNYLINSLKSKHPSLLILGIQHPETFKKDKHSQYNFNTFNELTDFYSKSLNNYFNTKSLNKIQFIGASLGALIAHECCAKMNEMRHKIDTVSFLKCKVEQYFRY